MQIMLTPCRKFTALRAAIEAWRIDDIGRAARGVVVADRKHGATLTPKRAAVKMRARRVQAAPPRSAALPPEAVVSTQT